MSLVSFHAGWSSEYLFWMPLTGELLECRIMVSLMVVIVILGVTASIAHWWDSSRITEWYMRSRYFQFEYGHSSFLGAVHQRSWHGKDASNHSVVTANEMTLHGSRYARGPDCRYRIRNVIHPGWRCPVYISRPCAGADETKQAGVAVGKLHLTSGTLRSLATYFHRKGIWST